MYFVYINECFDNQTARDFIIICVEEDSVDKA